MPAEEGSGWFHGVLGGRNRGLSKKALTKAIEDHRVSNVALGAVRVELAEEKQKLATSQQTLVTVNQSLDNSNANLATWENTKKLLEKANAELNKSKGTIRKYLEIFNLIYDSNMEGSMALTVGLAGTTAAWHAVRINEAWANQYRRIRRRSSLGNT
jgi:hypothetical protein